MNSYSLVFKLGHAVYKARPYKMRKDCIILALFIKIHIGFDNFVSIVDHLNFFASLSSNILSSSASSFKDIVLAFIVAVKRYSYRRGVHSSLNKIREWTSFGMDYSQRSQKTYNPRFRHKRNEQYHHCQSTSS